MKKNNPHIKNLYSISLEIKVNIINMIVNSCFQEDEYGDVEYTPHFKDFGITLAISKYLIDGIDFGEEEDIYNSIINDIEVKQLVDEIVNRDEFQDLLDDAIDIIDFKKKMIIAKSNRIDDNIIRKALEVINKKSEKIEKEFETIDNLNTWLNEQRKLNSLITPEMQKQFAESLNVDSLISSVIEKYGESELFHKNREIIETTKKLREQEAKIVDLQNELKTRV